MRIVLLAWWRVLGVTAILISLAWCVGAGVVSVAHLALYLALALFGAWVTPKTWTAVVVTVADLNTHIRDNLNYLKTAIDAVQVPNDLCQGRLTLTTAVPVTTADVLAATTLRFAPYGGNQIALYSGTAWAIFTFAELSIAVPASTSQMYDAFVYDNAGVRTLELLAWTNDTTRATALVTQDGVLCKSGALTRRYVGSFRTTTVSGQTEDSFAKRFVWNYYNRVTRVLRVNEATDSWTYATVANRQANASTANQLACVLGVAEVPVQVEVRASWIHSVIGGFLGVGIGEDSTTVFVAGSQFNYTATDVANNMKSSFASLRKYPAVGYHFYAWLEIASGATATIYGDNAGANGGPQSGISGTLEG